MRSIDKIDQVEGMVTDIRDKVEEMESMLRANQYAAAFCAGGLGPNAQPPNWEQVFRNLLHYPRDLAPEFERLEDLLVQISSSRQQAEQVEP